MHVFTATPCPRCGNALVETLTGTGRELRCADSNCAHQETLWDNDFRTGTGHVAGGEVIDRHVTVDAMSEDQFYGLGPLLGHHLGWLGSCNSGKHVALSEDDCEGAPGLEKVIAYLKTHRLAYTETLELRHLPAAEPATSVDAALARVEAAVEAVHGRLSQRDAGRARTLLDDLERLLQDSATPVISDSLCDFPDTGAACGDTLA
ncbi:hypothetical protein ACQP2U_43390 (plasmid) [Nocardia sp. CA-084685]|uniref:hypothetical protein n=1 Tax=Nocardia sp. CA-084685 TaxID=3239970 RepID=UPI003D996122